MSLNKPFENLKDLTTKKAKQKKSGPKAQGRTRPSVSKKVFGKVGGKAGGKAGSMGGGKAAPAKKNPVSAPPRPASEFLDPEETQAQDDNLFMNAMNGVEPINPRGGRVVEPEKPAIEPPPTDQSEDEALQKFLSGEFEFELEYTDEYMQGHVRSLDKKLLRQLKAGTYSVEGHLDLHGYTSDQAQEALLFFLRESYLQGRRTVLVVPGRGKGSPYGYGVLRRQMQYWITREPLRRIVLAFCTALPKHGGAGAIYVLLRKKKKDEGKVRFNKANFWGDDLL